MHPLWGDRRTRERRRHEDGPPVALNERRKTDRRNRAGIRIALPPRLAGGWIAFECGEERRRIAPIPADWSELDEEGLRSLWERAEELPPRRKRLVE